jgi:hypothetical protein
VKGLQEHHLHTVEVAIDTGSDYEIYTLLFAKCPSNCSVGVMASYEANVPFMDKTFPFKQLLVSDPS